MDRLCRLLLILLLPISALQSQKTEAPNVIIILTDDQGYGDVGFNGCKDIPTPNIDRIARNGTVFSNGYVSYPVCGPSRAGLITGRYQDRFGFGRNPVLAPEDSTMGLPLTEQTLATVLGKVGYQSMAIGKWHLGAHPTLHPLKRGFSEFFGFLSGGHRYFPKEWVLWDINDIEKQNDGYRTKLMSDYTRVDEKEYLTDALSREAVKFVQRNPDHPFFLYLAYNAPHGPLQATPKYTDRFAHIKNKKRRTYAAMVSAVDDGVGHLLDALEKMGLEDNTIVFFLSDNGGPEKKNGSDNGPLKEGKGSLFEGGVRVPFAVQWPGQIPAGQVYEKAVISLDIFATAVSEASAPIRASHPYDGVNLIPYLNGSDTGSPHEYLFWRKFDQNWYIAQEGTSGWKLMTGQKNEPRLFDLKLDIGEETDIASRKKKVVKKLNKKQQDWLMSMKDPSFLGLSQRKEYYRIKGYKRKE
ncbi:MAG: sulfatase-like hydrolase/transferase [Saprospiraceae bacterium]|nr:sulfatase-like hydrolase/transferase [Saprospiraceae bacterium]